MIGIKIKRRRRALLLLSGLVLLAVIGFALYYALSLVSIGAAYKAKILCSGVFVANREPSSILNTDLAADDLSILRYVEAEVDYVSREVTADFFGIIIGLFLSLIRKGCGVPVQWSLPIKAALSPSVTLPASIKIPLSLAGP
ncbi:MAG: hypothetical protein ACMUIA_07310 [bacterium]